MSTITATRDGREGASVSVRWLQLVMGCIVMMATSSPQYTWTLFTGPFQEKTGALLSDVQWTITLLIVIQTFFSPCQGFLVDRFGAKLLIAAGALLSGLGWVLSSYVATLSGLYLTYGLFCGIGTGIVYVGVVGLMCRWFPHSRGFATGVVAAGYGFGAILTTFPIDSMIKADGYQPTLLNFGVIFAIIGVLASLFLRTPREGEVDETSASGESVNANDVSPSAMLRTPVFWLMFVMMSMMSTGGLMVITQFASFTKSFGITKETMVVILGFSMAAVPAALTFDRLTNGLTRPFFGWVSDTIGRENTMGLAFIMEGIAIALMLHFRSDPFLLVILSGIVFFGWGEIFSLFPSTLTDTFGTKHATTNYGFLYMAQGIGSILGAPVAAMVFESTGSWIPVFSLIIGMDILAGLLALFVLKPMRRKYLAR